MTKKLSVDYTTDYGYCVQEREYDEEEKLLGIWTHFFTDGASDNHQWYCEQVKDLIERIRDE